MALVELTPALEQIVWPEDDSYPLAPGQNPDIYPHLIVWDVVEADGGLRAIVKPCGEHKPLQGKTFCTACLASNRTRYPQGWRYYPGDICRHGTYVGGMDVDWMCAACENGDD